MAHASLGLSREQANGYVLEFLNHYEHSHEDPPPGRPFPELYNLETLEPGPEWLDVYHQVCSAIADLGLDIDGGWRRVKHG